VLRNYPYQESEHTLYGTRLNEAAALYIRDDKPLADEFMFMAPTLDALKALPGDKHCELRMSVNRDLKACGWKDEDCWFKGIADLAIVDGKRGFVADYKSGSNKYPDQDQLELMALMMMATFPDLEEVRGMLLFVKHDTLTKKTIKRTEWDTLWAKYRRRDGVRIRAHEIGVFMPKQSGLCRRSCAVTSCEFNGL
jgi:hypothetical protein